MSLLAGSLAFAGLIPVTDTIPGEYIVRLTPLAYRQSRPDSVFRRMQVLGRIDSLGTILIRADERSARQIQNSAGVREVSANGVVVPCFTPNDPQLNLQWYLPKVNALAAWDLGRGSVQTPIAIVDSGIQYTHPDLAAVYQTGGYDFVNNDSDPMDDFGHGTLVSGVASAATNNSEGVAGVGFGCPVIGIKVANAGGGSTIFNLAQGITYAVDSTNARVINVSLGTSTFNSTLNDACEHALDAGVVVVAAAGNNNSTNFFYPAATPGVVAVGASTQSDDRWSQSNYGSWVEVAAPGEGIHSTNLPSTYGAISGTSLASPLVAGLAGLAYNQLGAGRSVAKANLVRSTIYAGASDVATWTHFGRIDARDTLKFAKPVSPLSFAWSKFDTDSSGLVTTTTTGGDVYMAHPQTRGTSSDIRIAKYDSAGALVRERFLDGFGQLERVAKLATDVDGNLYVTASAYATNGFTDILVAKYDAAGNLKWKKTWGGVDLRDDLASSIAIGATNTVVVGSTKRLNNRKYAFLWAVRNSDGATVVTKTYSLSTMYEDEANDVAVRPDGKFYVGTTSRAVNQSFNAVVLLFDTVAKTVASLAVYNGPGNTKDTLIGVRTAKNGEAIMGGQSDDGTSFMVRVRPTGGFYWVNRSEGQMQAMTLDTAGVPYWTGLFVESGTSRGYVTRKLDQNSGVPVWSRKVGGFGNTRVEGYHGAAVAMVQSGGAMVVTGTIENIPSKDVHTLWYNLTNGQLLKVARYDAGGAVDEGCGAVVSVVSKNVFMSCLTFQASGAQARLVKYAP